NLERGKAIQIVARPGGDPDMERDPNCQADKADRPAHSLGERQKLATYYCHRWSARGAAFVPFVDRADRPDSLRFFAKATGAVPIRRRSWVQPVGGVPKCRGRAGDGSSD